MTSRKPFGNGQKKAVEKDGQGVEKMIGNPVSLIQVPNQRLFSTKVAAQYLGICEDTLRKYADLGDIPARRLGRRRVFRLEDLDTFIEALPQYCSVDTLNAAENPVAERR